MSGKYTEIEIEQMIVATHSFDNKYFVMEPEGYHKIVVGVINEDGYAVAVDVETFHGMVRAFSKMMNIGPEDHEEHSQ